MVDITFPCISGFLDCSSYKSQKSFCPYWSACALDEAMQNISPDVPLVRICVTPVGMKCDFHL